MRKMNRMVSQILPTMVEWMCTSSKITPRKFQSPMFHIGGAAAEEYKTLRVWGRRPAGSTGPRLIAGDRSIRPRCLVPFPSQRYELLVIGGDARCH
ncbi:hypothetical protein EYF80_046560 [Liparis tanakae]|uniref:Uncharacterized protein n=1 Tax=Liparis tanakae TaxID=230148 RepID=A0A4Z2FRA2_9TELE|nr:hypothetical protein EYF80_046560 [Liparis tanakae]